MKVIPLAINHVELELENGAILDVNDGTSVRKIGMLTITAAKKSPRSMINLADLSDKVQIVSVLKVS